MMVLLLAQDKCRRLRENIALAEKEYPSVFPAINTVQKSARIKLF
jgi:hypothetical protein